MAFLELEGNPAGLPQQAFTHGGRFHADDVFSGALLRLLRPDICIKRGMVVPQGFEGIVFDIGDGPFDHHQKSSPRRANGAAYAAFGLLWREYGQFFLSEAEALRFDTKFVQPLDIDDNTGCGNALAGLIGAYNPTWDDAGQDTDAAYFEALEVAHSLLGHKLASLAAVERGRGIVQEALAQMQDGMVVLQKYVPWKPVLVESGAEFVLFPSGRGGLSLQCVPKDYNGKTGNKVPLPREWWGRQPGELVQLTGVPDISFCHASGFMAAVGSEGSARRLCALAREEQQRRSEEKAGREAACKGADAT